MTRMALRSPSITLNGEVSLFVDSRGKHHSFNVDLMLDLKNGEVKGALVVEKETDKEVQLIGAKGIRVAIDRYTLPHIIRRDAPHRRRFPHRRSRG